MGWGGGISGRVRALNLTVPLGSGRVGSDDLGYGPGSGFSFEPVQTSNIYTFKKMEKLNQITNAYNNISKLNISMKTKNKAKNISKY